MSEKNADKPATTGFVRFGGFGTSFANSLRQQAQELTAKAAASVTEINSKVQEASAAAAAATVTQQQALSPPTTQSTADVVTPNSAVEANAVASSATPGASTPRGTSGGVDNASKEELIEVLQKLNKKVKALNVLRQQLTERAETAEVKHQRLKQLVTEDILQGMIPTDNPDHKSENASQIDEVLQLQNAWRQVEERNALMLQTVQQEYQNLRAQIQRETASTTPTIVEPVEDSAANAQLWEEREASLMQQHQAQLESMKESLRKEHEDALKELREELQQQNLQAVRDEENRVRQAAAAQFQIFKEKVATARQAELQKIKAELLENAQEQLQSKLAEQTAQHKLDLDFLQQELEFKYAAASEEEKKHSEDLLAQIEEMNKQNELDRKQLQEENIRRVEEVEKARQEVEQSFTTDLEERLQEAVGDLRRNHEQEMENFKLESNLKLEEANKISFQRLEDLKVAEDKAQLLSKQINFYKEEHEKSVQVLRETLDSTLSSREILVKQLNDMVLKKNEELEAMREELKAAYEQERDKALSEVLADKENMRVDLEERMKLLQESLTTSVKKHNDILGSLETEHAQQIERLTMSMEKKFAILLDQAKSDHDALLTKTVRTVAADSEMTVEKLTNELQSELNVLRLQLQQRNEEYREIVEREELLKSQVDDLSERLEKERNDRKHLLESINNGEMSSDEEMSHALEKQRALFDESMENLQKSHDNELHVLKSDMEQIVATRDQALNDLSLLMQKLTDTSARLDEMNSKATEKANLMEHEHAQLHVMLKAKETELSTAITESNYARLKHEKMFEDLAKELADVKEKDASELLALKLKHEAEVISLRKETENEDENLKRLSMENADLRAAVLELQVRDENMKLKYEEELTRNQMFEREKELLASQLIETEKIAEDKMAALKQTITEFKEKSDSELLSLQEEIEKAHMERDDVRQHNLEAELEIKRLQHLNDEALLTIQNMKQEHSIALTSIKNDLEAKFRAEIADARSVALFEKDAELKVLKASFDDKLQSAAKKEALFTESFNKVKNAYGLKLKKIQGELTEKAQKLEEENAHLKALNVSFSSSDCELREAHNALKKRAEELLEENNNLSLKLQDKIEAFNTVQNEMELKITTLQTQLELVNKELIETKTAAEVAISNDELEDKMKEIENKHSEVLNKLKHDYDLALKNAKDELVLARQSFEGNLVSELDKQNASFELQLAAQKNKFTEEAEDMRKSMESHVDKMRVHFQGKVDAAREEAATERKKIEQACKEKDEKIAMLVDRLKGLTTSTSNLRAENDDMKSRLVTEGNTQKNLRAQLNAMKKEMDDRLENSSATVSSLLEQQEKAESEKILLHSQVSTMKVERDTYANKVEELSGKLEALTANLNAMAEDRKIQEEKLRSASKSELKLKASEVEVADLREQINKLKLDLTKSASVITRLQAEKDANERNHGQRTALVGMLEAQLSELNDKNSDLNAKLEAALYDLTQRDEAMRGTEEEFKKLENELAEARVAAKRASESLASAQKGADSSAKSSKAVESLLKELQAAKQQMARKSAAAQSMLAQREAECSELRKANKILQQEVDKGSLSDRKIFELAAKQSNRESQAATEIHARNKTIDLMRKKVIERDSQLAAAEKRVQEVEGQIEELFRARRREDVNLDYLKSIVVQYLSLPSGSTERDSLLPVLATLLQFNAQDHHIIEKGKKKSSWWDSITPTFINAPDHSTVLGSTSEISRPQTDHNGGQRRSAH